MPPLSLPHNLWETVKCDFKSLFPEDVFQMWFEPVVCLEASEDSITLGVPNDFAAIWINDNYLDLITQRLLKAVIAAEGPPYGKDELTALARHCTEQEVNAAKVERQVSKSAAALLLSSRIGERFDGLVTGASAKGTWVRIVRPATEGRVVRGFQGLDVGDRVRVELVHTDVERGFIDFVHSGAAA